MVENAWMFPTEPTPDQVETRLKEVKPWHGAPEGKTMADYQNFVIAISQRIGPRDNKQTVWRLYTTVAGKLAILHDAHRDKDGNITPITEEVEIDFKGTMVMVKGTLKSPIYGSVFETGTGVTGDGASGADLTNPVENAMTSWRGRAASALIGAGVLPYTGIASAEEVQSAENRSAMAESGIKVITDGGLGQQPKQPASKPVDTHVIKNNMANMQKGQKLNDAQFETLMAEYLQSEGMEYDGTAYDYVAQQDVTFLNGILRFIKAKKEAKDV